MTVRTAWMDQASCAGLDPELFFTVSTSGRIPRLVLRLCGSCPVQDDCLEDALALPTWLDTHGVRGGLGARSRAKIRTERGQG